MKTKFSLMIVSFLLMVALAACGGETAATETASGQLNADYTDALTVQGQLALGTMQLEGTELAVDAVQAAELQTLWNAVQSLSSSDTVAAAEIDAIVNQIQNTMTTEQVAAIAEMALTSDSIMALVESGELELGRGGGSAPEGADTSGMTRPEGDFAGGGPPDGGMVGEGTASGDMSEDDMATRQAERESGDMSGFQEQALVTAVLNLLEGKIS